MKNLAIVAKQTANIKQRDKGSWLTLYYSFAHDSVYTRPADDRFTVTMLINPQKPEDIKAAVVRWLNT